MQDVRAILRHLRIAPRKVRLVVDTVRGMDVRIAERNLSFSQKIAAKPVLKLLRSAIANAEHNFHMDAETLFIKKITADDGPTLKRYRPRAFGSAAPIRKRSSHVLLILGQKEGTKEIKTAKADKDDSEKTDEKVPATKAKKLSAKPAPKKRSVPAKKTTSPAVKS